MYKLSMKIFSLVFLLSFLFDITAFAADIAVTPATLDMGFRLASQNSATQPVTISNSGAADLMVNSITVSGGGADAFSATPGTCPSLTPTIVAGGSCTINVTFTPTTGQAYSASLDLASNSTQAPVISVALSGSGAYPLSVFIASSTGTGTVWLSAPGPVDAGLSCAPDAAFCGAYPGGTSITLTPQPSSISTFSGWTGCPMTMGDACFVSINSAVNATATFSLASLQSIISSASSGEIIKLPIVTYGEAVVMNRPGVLLTLSGGWTDHTFVNQAGFTSIAGSVTIADGTLILENIDVM